jgi:hypothetical protein
VKLVEKIRVVREVVHKEGLQFIISRLIIDHAVPAQDSMGVGIDNKYGSACSIE